ncbi:hypothetical protein CRN84_00825 [Budvicia aquatica]|uniref:Uncharacterized protein n=1 Tax=Budvicia aquatica TaxID=82979 RepID=A0A2C6DHS8_9GAMM|nr:hypothetical protein CRN84_00825 [Budvicia aquatica]
MSRDVFIQWTISLRIYRERGLKYFKQKIRKRSRLRAASSLTNIYKTGSNQFGAKPVKLI